MGDHCDFCGPEPSFADRCPSCFSPEPHLHPAVQHEGEVQPCPDDFHRRVTPQNTPQRIAATQRLIESFPAGESRETSLTYEEDGSASRRHPSEQFPSLETREPPASGSRADARREEPS